MRRWKGGKMRELGREDERVKGREWGREDEKENERVMEGG